MAQVEPGQIKGQLPKAPPEECEEMRTILDDFKRIILPGITHWQHPSFFAYFPANTSEPSILAEFLTAALGAQCMLWETSPAATELEEVVMEWLRQILALPETFTGVIQDSASARGAKEGEGVLPTLEAHGPQEPNDPKEVIGVQVGDENGLDGEPGAEPHDLPLAGAQRHSDADLMRALLDGE